MTAMDIRRLMNKHGVATTSVLAAVFLITASPAVRGSPVQVIDCAITLFDTPTPAEYLDFHVRFHRHVIQVAPYEVLETDYWAQGKFQDNGYFDVTVFPVEGDPALVKSIATRSTVQDGYGLLGDVFTDEATSMEESFSVAGWTVDSAQLILHKDDGSLLQTHLQVPDQLVRSDWDPIPVCEPGIPGFGCNDYPKECIVTFLAPGGGIPCQGPGGTSLLCTHGSYIGQITSITYEEHGADHAAPFVINAGLNDAWVSDGAPFQGLFITVYPELGLVFAAWFTFDTTVPPENTAVFGWSGQRWVTAVGPFTGNTASLKAELTTGGAFNSPVPLPQQNTDYGTVDLTFDDCGQGTVTFNFPGPGLAGSYPIHRVVENTALCEALSQP